MASISGSQGGLGDILSLALKKTGVSSGNAPRQLTTDEPSSFLNHAAGAIDDSLLSTDIGTLTEGLFSDLSSVKSSANSQPSFPLERRVSVVASSPTVNGNATGLVHTPNQCVTPMSDTLSMPVLVKPEPATEQYQQSSVYTHHNSVQSFRPTSTQAAPSATTPLVSVSGSFSGVSNGVQPTAVMDFGGSSQGGAPALTTNSSQITSVPQDQTNPSHYNYSNVDDIDQDRLDEFLADLDPVDMPPPPQQYQNHPQLPAVAAYSSQQVPHGSTNAAQSMYTQSNGAVSVTGQAINSNSSPQFMVNQQQYGGIQQQMITPSYQGPARSMMSPHSTTQPHSQQMIPVSSVNGGHYVSPVSHPPEPMSTDLSDIIPSTSALLPPDTDIHKFLDLDDFEFDVDTDMSTDPLPSFGMSSVNLVQPSNQINFNGSNLVHSPVGSAVNATPLPYNTPLQQQQQLLSSRSNFSGHVQPATDFKPKLNFHNSVYGRSGQQPNRMAIQKARLASDRIPMPPQVGVSDVDSLSLSLSFSLSLWLSLSLSLLSLSLVPHPRPLLPPYLV